MPLPTNPRTSVSEPSARLQALRALRREQSGSLGFVLIRCGQLFNQRGIDRLNAEGLGLQLREAHTRLVPYLQAPEGVRITDLARQVGITKQAVQQLVADLVRLGVARVGPDADDARARRVLLSDLGIAILRKGTRTLREIERELGPQLRSVAAPRGRPQRQPGAASEAQSLHTLLCRLLVVLERPSAARLRPTPARRSARRD